MKKLFQIFGTLTLVLTVTGCATSRTSLDISLPEASKDAPSKGRQVYIRSIADARQFEDSPKTADIPSLKGGLGKATQSLKSSAVGRKRNSFGKALGDYVLDNGQTVDKVIYEATRIALVSLGYEVTDLREQAKPDAMVLDISIDKFWSWFAPGFSSIQIKSDITVNHTLTPSGGSGKKIEVAAHAVNNYQIASNSNWKKTLAAVLDDYVRKTKKEFENIS